MEKELFNQLLKSAKQAVDISKGKAKPSRRFVYKPKDIAEIRHRLKLSQDAFASLLQVPAATFRNWEQGRTLPDAPAQTLLLIADKQPKVLRDLSVRGDIFYVPRSAAGRRRPVAPMAKKAAKRK